MERGENVNSLSMGWILYTFVVGGEGPRKLHYTEVHPDELQYMHILRM